ncbi:MAG: PatB family C-S lyase [Clostridia bacterium]|nr:PatB family C-S lyase [Clostridia bacterium]
MIYDKAFFDKPFDRRGTNTEKWDALEERVGHEMNPMWVADMDFQGPEEITNALVQRAMHPAYGYTPPSASHTKAMLDFMQRRHGVTLKESEQTLMPCVITGLRAAVMNLTKPGDTVIIQTPVYGPFYASIRENDRVIAECLMHRDENNRYTMNYEAIEEACKAGAKLMLLCNPHNPVGRAWSKEELIKLVDILNRYNVALLSDEIHEDFVYEKDAFTPILSIVTDPEANVAAATSASKTFNLAGLKHAVFFSRNTKLVERVTMYMREVGVVQNNIFGMVAAEAAYTYGDAWLDGMLAYIKEGADILREELKVHLPKAIMTPLEATYLAWVDLNAYGFTCEQLLERCRNAGVEFTPGTFFGPETGEGFMRVNLACQHDRVRLAVKQLAEAINA